jgi:hypothetical protein
MLGCSDLIVVGAAILTPSGVLGVFVGADFHRRFIAKNAFGSVVLFVCVHFVICSRLLIPILSISLCY